MSVQALSWVLDHIPHRGAEKLFLIAIANYAGPEPEALPNGDSAWVAWPAHGTIRRNASLARDRTVTDVASRLVAEGVIEREINNAPDSRIPKDKRPNLYRILLSAGVSCGVTRCTWCGVTRDAERGDARRQSGVTRDDRAGCRETAPKPSLEPSVEPSVEPRVVDANPWGVTDFDAFWVVYPRKVDKGAAKRAFSTALRRASASAIIEGAMRYRDDPNRVEQFTKHAATWLNGESWDNPPLPARRVNGNDPDEAMRRQHQMISDTVDRLTGGGR